MAGSIAYKIEAFMEAGSWIRRMFEEGDALKKQYGKENVFDLTLGNPMGDPPKAFRQALHDALDEPVPGKHGYMANAGYHDVRAKLAKYLAKEHGVALEAVPSWVISWSFCIMPEFIISGCQAVKNKIVSPTARKAYLINPSRGPDISCRSRENPCLCE